MLVWLRFMTDEMIIRIDSLSSFLVEIQISQIYWEINER
jgi:hypothetical protein